MQLTFTIPITILLFFTALPTLAEEIVINAVGDIMLAGRWSPVLKNKGYGFPFDGLRDELAKGDINLANLESPIARSGKEFTTKKYRFRAEPELAQALYQAGFQLVTLANNHSMDFGDQALFETMQNLESAGITWIGAGANLAEARKMALFNVKGEKIAFLGYSLTQPVEFFANAQRPGTMPGWEKHVKADIVRARKEADYVIVTFHWGTEGSSTARANQRSAAHKAIEAGADAVIGHHPHVLQGVERYKNGIIFYSLGNFAFASTSKTADVAAMVRLRLNGAQREAEILPLDVLHSRVRFQPQPLRGKRAEAVIRQLNQLSEPLGSSIETRGDRFYITF
ncbi:MAG TPA: CapA family protein [Desulfuromonadaceae bacterium]|jgi:poly-gamma-glutamate synthesis protein (capsule biosynthesis protein)